MLIFLQKSRAKFFDFLNRSRFFLLHLEMHFVAQLPKDVATFATSTRIPAAMKKCSTPGYRPTIGYATVVKTIGTATKIGASASVLQIKYISVRYIPLRCSLKKIGNSAQNT